MIVCFAMVIFILHTAAMKGSQEYLVTYAVDSGMFTNQKAALLNSVVFGAGTWKQIEFKDNDYAQISVINRLVIKTVYILTKMIKTHVKLTLNRCS